MVGGDADGLITGGGDGAGGVDGDVCGIAIGEADAPMVRAVVVDPATPPPAPMDGGGAVAAKAGGGDISVEVNGDGTGVEVEAGDRAEGGGAGGQWRITTTTADGLGDQRWGEVTTGGEVACDGEIDGAGLVLGGLAAAKGEGGGSGISQAKDGTTTTGDGLSNDGSGITTGGGDGRCGGEVDGGTVIDADDRATEADCVATSGGGVKATARDRLEDHTGGVDAGSRDGSGVGEVD